MSEKLPDRHRHAREERRRAYLSAPTLRDQFPNVEQVVLQLSFTDYSGMSQYSAQTHTFSPAATAFFEIPCPSTVCTGGGFRSRQRRLEPDPSTGRGNVGQTRLPGVAEYGSSRYSSLPDAAALPSGRFVQQLTPALHKALLDRRTPCSDVRPLDQRLDRELPAPRFAPLSFRRSRAGHSRPVIGR